MVGSTIPLASLVLFFFIKRHCTFYMHGRQGFRGEKRQGFGFRIFCGLLVRSRCVGVWCWCWIFFSRQTVLV
ncbi:hypothetical protein CTAM01_13096 [Colletotrichum tamarilloi]|uniref:Secreted protein n=1 Tax=Colletotrichum tamarilloi TaxID=1209934 RepID=A0ABQ9QT31_9PEZI|nr:uncharacterized protein CTAM01_13096 [Colletotrichum tamarilloi]KAI3526894.1 hypothetical protein CSPX01_17393 [Colletotrichum filicis]KAK1484092.1 hypothetical protein CTAM01_13096 [Colletotrichum tamarilloi]